LGFGFGVWGFGVWGLGVWPNPPTPNPQSPIPNPHAFFITNKFKNLNFNLINVKEIIKLLKFVTYFI
jgi:hypothetical protein